MPPGPGTYELGPASGSLRIRTGREGVAARVGHDLLLELGQWSGTLVVGRTAGRPVRVEAVVDLGSLHVLEGSGGAVPLTVDDRRRIAATAATLLDVADEHEARLRCTGTAGAGSTEGDLRGDLTVRGVTVPVVLHVVAGAGGTWTATTRVRQSDFGIAPYRALLGTLRLADAVDVEAKITLPQRRGRG